MALKTPLPNIKAPKYIQILIYYLSKFKLLPTETLKSVSPADFINRNKSDVIAVTEIWLRSDDTDSFIAIVSPPGYKWTHFPWPDGRANGVGFCIHDDIDFKVLPQQCFKTFEKISVHLSMGNAQNIIFHTVCRPPNVSKANFNEDFSSFVEGVAYHVVKI